MTPTPLPSDVPPIPADWSQFFPDLIISVLVGIGLALFVLGMEGRIATRREKQEAELNWSLVRPRVSAAMGQYYSELHVVMGGGLASLIYYVGPFMKLAKKYPFAAWSEASPKNEEMKLAAEAANALFELDGVIASLAPAMQHFHGMSGDGDPNRRWWYESYSIHQVMEFTHEPQVPDEWSADDRADRAARHAYMLTEIGDAVERFKLARPAFEKAWTAARTKIRGTWGDDLGIDI